MKNIETLLLVEDDKLLRQALKEKLEHKDFIVFEAANGKRSTEIIERHNVDLILLDVELPDGSGLDFIPDIRCHTNVPIIMVSGREDPETKVSALSLGADDYVCKPVDIEELNARIKAHLRRFYEDPHHTDISSRHLGDAQKIHFGNWMLDRKRFDVFDGQDNPAGLTIREFHLLEMLILNADHAVKRDDLCETLREENYIPTPRAIDIKVTRIRKKIRDDAMMPEMIKTVRGVGYMFQKDRITGTHEHT